MAAFSKFTERARKVILLAKEEVEFELRRHEKWLNAHIVNEKE